MIPYTAQFSEQLFVNFYFFSKSNAVDLKNFIQMGNVL